ncbi:MAG: hypothetical protein ACI8Y7_000804 [Candidatus Woesearchaeota archaeon]|jgi:hypothetical protein
MYGIESSSLGNHSIGVYLDAIAKDRGQICQLVPTELFDAERR